MVFKDVIIIDIETAVENNEVNPDKDIHRLTGYYSYKTNKFGLTVNRTKIQKLIGKFYMGLGITGTLEFD